jgi:hypothetical protein
VFGDGMASWSTLFLDLSRIQGIHGAGGDRVTERDLRGYALCSMSLKLAQAPKHKPLNANTSVKAQAETSAKAPTNHASSHVTFNVSIRF